MRNNLKKLVMGIIILPSNFLYLFARKREIKSVKIKHSLKHRRNPMIDREKA